MIYFVVIEICLEICKGVFLIHIQYIICVHTNFILENYINKEVSIQFQIFNQLN